MSAIDIEPQAAQAWPDNAMRLTNIGAINIFFITCLPSFGMILIDFVLTYELTYDIRLKE